MTEHAIDIVGTQGSARICDLELDPQNPRLISSKEGDSQQELALAIEMAHESIVVAESIAKWGFFANEPLIVLPRREDGKYVVVEGNRRLVALLGLSYPDVRSRFFESAKWNALAASSSISPDQHVPIIIVERREQVASIIGFRHISGILDWTPYAQAAFIADLVDAQQLPFDTVASMIGKRRQDVAELYRNFRIAKQAQSMDYDSAGLEDAFSLLTVAMGSPHIREFVGAPSGAKVDTNSDPIPAENAPQLIEVLSWIFGSDEQDRIVEDSRKISSLGKVIANPVGLAELRKGVSLKAAQAAIEEKGMDPRDRLLVRLRTSINALKAASEDIGDFGSDTEVQQLLSNVQEELNGLASFTDMRAT